MIDDEKTPTSPARRVFQDGVELISRYRKQHEYVAMTRALTYIGELAHAITSIFCDSQVGAVYAVDLDYPGKDMCFAVGDALDRAFMEVDGGHGGVYVSGPGAEDLWEVAPAGF
jgi:hypothetical protein